MLEDRAVPLQAAARERSHAGEQFFQVERLDEVIVSTLVERGHFITNGIARGHHQNHRSRTPPAQRTADVESADSGQHEIEHDDVVTRMFAQLEPDLAGCCQVDRMVLPA